MTVLTMARSIDILWSLIKCLPMLNALFEGTVNTWLVNLEPRWRQRDTPMIHVFHYDKISKLFSPFAQWIKL